MYILEETYFLECNISFYIVLINKHSVVFYKNKMWYDTVLGSICQEEDQYAGTSSNLVLKNLVIILALPFTVNTVNLSESDFHTVRGSNNGVMA